MCLGPRYEISTLQLYRDDGCWKDNYVEGGKHIFFFPIKWEKQKHKDVWPIV